MSKALVLVAGILVFKFRSEQQGAENKNQAKKTQGEPSCTML
jgi:hypothetical protein